MANLKDAARPLASDTGVDVSRCYQCGKCSAGCVQAAEMDIPPSRVMRLLQTGSADDYRSVLSSKAIWLCLNCENCYERCPQSVDIPAVMDFLRQRSLEAGLAHRDAKKIIAFHRSFLSSVENTGRLYEVGLEAGYKLRTLDLLQDVALVPAMLAKGKLHMLPEVVRDRRAVKDIFKKTTGNKKNKEDGR
ncbi:MAG: 4Fe-4S dicluster domain-containing protein [Flavobacteriales bacterium]|nr:4Fe-4S dicluster domain-containing protein [Flavobacteriales bacterium]